MKKLIIRPEKEEDYGEIYELIRIAFQTAKVADGDEHDYTSKLRASNNYIPELALVAIIKNKIVGHIMLTKFYVKDEDTRYEALLLSPLSVMFEHRNQGIGGSLIKNAITKAKEQGYKFIFLAGDPDYYFRFDFQPSVYFGIFNVNNIPEQFVLVHELIPGSLQKIKGKINFPS